MRLTFSKVSDFLSLTKFRSCITIQSSDRKYNTGRKKKVKKISDLKDYVCLIQTDSKWAQMPTNNNNKLHTEYRSFPIHHLSKMINLLKLIKNTTVSIISYCNLFCATHISNNIISKLLYQSLSKYIQPYLVIFHLGSSIPEMP